MKIIITWFQWCLKGELSNRSGTKETQYKVNSFINVLHGYYIKLKI